jgi:hypothetical protein
MIIILYADNTPLMRIKSISAKILRIIEGLKEDGYRIRLIQEKEEN